MRLSWKQLFCLALAAHVAACAPLDEEPATLGRAEPLSSIDCSERGDRGYRSGAPFDIRVVTVDGKPVERETANAYFVMASAAARDGVEIRVVSGFRTQSEQQVLYACFVNCNCNNCNRAAQPGYSNHQSGHALDLNTSAPGVLSWLNARGAAYGFARTVPSEPWHWEWWGGGPGGGPCGGCPARCEGSVIVQRDCGRGDCAAFGSRCVDDALGVRCAFALCPDRGARTVCLDANRIGTCQDGALSTGDCSAYGSRCVDDALGARCAFFACPATGETTVCLDDRRLGTCRNGAISAGDCSAFGSRCVSDSRGARCAFYACPAAGETTVCLDDRTLGTCRDGAISTGDCGAFAAFCSTAGAPAARCVSAFCVANAMTAPTERDTCLPDGKIAHCTPEGGLTNARACPDGMPCTLTPSGARCGAEPEPVPDGVDPSADAGAVSSDSGVPPTDGAAVSSADAGAPIDASRVPDGGRSGTISAGCGCVAAGATPSSAPLAALVVVALVARRRRAR